MYTVAELIKVLQQCPQDYQVIMNFIAAAECWTIEAVGIDHEVKTVDLFSE